MIHLTIFLWVNPMIFHLVESYFDPPVPVDGVLFRAEILGPARRPNYFGTFLKPVDIVGSDRTLTQEIGRTITGLV